MDDAIRRSAGRAVPVTDELLDAYVNRPLAAVVVRAVAPTAMTPNHLTLLAMAAGTLGGVGLAQPAPAALVGAFAAVCAFMVLDCSDGQLARLRGGGTPVGRVIDGAGDYVVALALHGGLLAFLLRHDYVIAGHALTALEKFVAVDAAATSMIVHAAIFDHQKHRYLALTSHAGRAAVETSEQYRVARDGAGSRFERGLLGLFVAYLRVQEWVVARRGPAAPVDATVDAGDLAARARRLRLWGFVGPTTHAGLIAATALGCVATPYAPFAYCFVAAVAMNLFAAVLAFASRPSGRAP